MKKTLIVVKQSLYLILLVCAFSTANAQNVVRGRVVDKDGLPIPGARVSVKGGTESVLSDFDGSYRMIVEGEVEKLIVDYVGYNSRSVKVDEASEVVLQKTTLWNDVHKNNWMLSFQMAFPEVENKQPSYGLMVGWCRNFGGYVKGVWRPGVNKNIAGSFNVPDDVWLTGKYYSSFKAVTAGAVVRMKSPFHIYAGMGASNREVYAEIPGMGYSYYDYNDEYEGLWRLGFDVGVIFKIRYFMLNAGVIWTPGRPGMVGDFGIGISF